MKINVLSMIMVMMRIMIWILCLNQPLVYGQRKAENRLLALFTFLIGTQLNHQPSGL